MNWWKSSRKSTLSSSVHSTVAAPPVVLQVSEHLSAGRILCFNQALPKKEAVRTLIKTLTGVNAQTLEEAIEERERIGSMLIEERVAVPHARLAGLEAIHVALGLCPDGLLEADGKRLGIRVIVLFAAPLAQPRQTLAFLAGAAALFTADGLIERLGSARQPEEAVALIREVESRAAAA